MNLTRGRSQDHRHVFYSPPSGCTHCGIGEQAHMQRWAEGVGWHGWTEPTTEQTKQRMLARRAKSNPEWWVLYLERNQRLGYLAYCCEFTDGIEPLDDDLQDAAHALLAAGRLPAFAQWAP